MFISLLLCFCYAVGTTWCPFADPPKRHHSLKKLLLNMGTT